MKKIILSLLIFIFILQNACMALENKGDKMGKIVQTAGRDNLGGFAPEFAHYNDDILFGENWNNKDISIKTRCIITIVALMSQGITDTSLKYHLENAKKNGVTKEEIASVVTHTAFYSGWPKAWAVFNLAKDVWKEPALTEKEKYAATIMFPIGEPNTAYAKYFIGQSYIAPVSTSQVKMYNVTFEPKCRNNWHIHHAKSGGGQMLIAIGGRGYYQEWNKEPIEMNPGDVINIPANVKHWHGAAPDSWFSHLAVEVDGVETSNEWLEEVSDMEYNKLK
jgi:4-carboxymuconolactone decarboxylase